MAGLEEAEKEKEQNNGWELEKRNYWIVVQINDFQVKNKHARGKGTCLLALPEQFTVHIWFWQWQWA